MARVTYGPFITELTGSVAGMTFQQNPSGAIMRTKPAGSKGSTRYQRYTQQVLNSVNVLWFNLSQANKDLWIAHGIAETYIDLWARSMKLSGFQWFMSVNTNLTQCSRATLDTPAAYVPPPDFPVYTLSLVAGDLVANFTGTQDLRAYDIIWYATPPVTKASPSDRSKYIRLITIGNFNDTHEHLNNYYQNIFGISIVDLYDHSKCNIIVYARIIDKTTGYSSPMRVVVRKVPS